MLDPIRTDGPATSPLTLDEVKAHLRIDHNDEDATIQLYLDAATGYLEGPNGILDRALVTQSWSQAYPAFSDPIVLPVGLQPVQSVTALTYYDADGASQTLSDTLYRLVSNAADGPIVERTTTEAWPATAVRDDAVIVEFVAGEDPALLAAPIKQAMLLIIGHWYAVRETAAAGTYAEIPYAVTALLINHARIGFG